MVIDRPPDIDPRAARAQQFVIPSRRLDAHARSIGGRQLRAPGLLAGDFAHQDLRRLIQIVGHLDGQATAGRQPRDERGKQLRMVGHPWQHGIGENQIRGFRPPRIAGHPGPDIGDLETNVGKPRAGCRDHVSDVSKPMMRASGKRAAMSSVEFPGPHPTSIATSTAPGGTAARRSRAGRVRSSSNAVYCFADQLTRRAPSRPSWRRRASRDRAPSSAR